MSIYQEKLDLYADYIKEQQLLRYNNVRSVDIEKAKQDAHDHINDGIYKWINIWDGRHDLIGFVILGKQKNCPECHPDADYFISDMYIKPYERNKGYMTRTLKEYTETHPGIYSMLLFTEDQDNKNRVIQIFTKHLHAYPVEPDMTGCEPEEFYEPYFFCVPKKEFCIDLH